MCCQQGLRALSRAIGQERRFLAGNLQHRRAKGTQKAVGIARAKSRARPAGDDDDGLMSILPARVTQCTGLRGVRWNFSKPDRCIAVEAPERPRDACRTCESAVEQRQSLDRAVIHHQRCANRIDPAEREFLTRRFQAELAHLVGQPVPGHSIDVCSGAMESLFFVSANDRADALLHTPLQFVYRDVEIRPRSLHLDVGGPDHLGPFLGFIADELAEVVRRARKHHAAEVGEPRLHLGIGKRGVDLGVEFLDDR